MSEDDDIERIASVLEDSTARTILTEASREPLSAETLSERCGTSKPTVYRRLEDLRACNLLVERTKLDTERGHHRTMYATNLKRITIDLRDGQLRFSIDRSETMADRFTRLIEEM